MTDNLSVVKNTVNNITSQEVERVVEGDFLTLKIAAKQFLDKVEGLSRVYEKAIQQQLIKDKISIVYTQMKQSEKYTQQILQYQHHFQKLLNEFLNKTVYLTYITKEGNFYFYNDANVGKIYAKSLKNEGRGRIKSNALFSANDLNENLKKAIAQSVTLRKPVYETALTRFYRNKQQIRMKYERYQPTHDTYYWWKKKPNVLGWTNPTSVSRIAQGYAEAVINEASDVGGSNDIQKSLQALWNYVEVDNIPATIREDIVYNKDGSVQFAVKTSSSFQTASVGQYFRLAYNITQISKILTLEQFKKYLPGLINLDKMSKQILDVIQGVASDKIKEKVDQFLEDSYIKLKYNV